MRKFKFIGLAFAAFLSFGSLTANAQSLSPNTKWHWNKGKIVIETPERPAGQKDVLGLALPKMKTVRIGLVGLGMRGPGAVENFSLIPGVEVVALCGFVKERAEKQNERLRKNGLAPFTMARRDMRSCASAPTSTSFISLPTGSIMLSWLSVHSRTARTWQMRCLRQ